MKIDRKFLIFIGISILTISNANAAMVNCPAGCFCLNDGKYDNSGQVNPEGCNAKGQLLQSCYGLGLLFYGGTISCNHTPDTYSFDQFSELYEGYFGYYGVLNGHQIVYMPRDYGNQSVYDCPTTYPQSDPGAKTIHECYKYGTHGDKVYYTISASTGGTTGGSNGSMSGGQGGTTSTVTCAEGTYLPANSTTCATCSASMHHICSGGTFSTRNNTKIQGLKVECFPGEYLPRGAIQCSPCKSEHLCVGGIYKAGVSEDVGSVMNAGYIFNNNHSVERCSPGYYMPGNSQTCVACSGNYACPGGLFYTDGGPYQLSRGRILCAYGHPNTAHTECISNSTSPSYVGQQIHVTLENQQPAMASQQPSSPTGPGQQTAKKNQQRLSAIQVPIVSNTRTDTALPEQNNQDPQLETAKKLISSGVAIPVDLTTPAPSATSSTSTTNVDNTKSFIPPKTGIKRGAARFR